MFLDPQLTRRSRKTLSHLLRIIFAVCPPMASPAPLTPPRPSFHVAGFCAVAPGPLLFPRPSVCVAFVGFPFRCPLCRGTTYPFVEFLRDFAHVSSDISISSLLRYFFFKWSSFPRSSFRVVFARYLPMISSVIAASSAILSWRYFARFPPGLPAPLPLPCSEFPPLGSYLIAAIAASSICYCRFLDHGFV